MSPELYSEDELVERPAVELLRRLTWETVDAYNEEFGPLGTLGRDSRRDVFLQHRLHRSLLRLNPNLPRAVLEGAIAEAVRERSAMDPTRANREVYDLLRDGYLANGVTTRARADSAGHLHRLAELADERLACCEPGVGRRRALSSVVLTRAVRQRHPAGADGVQGSESPVRAAYDENLRDYRDTIPQLFVAERVRDPVERLGGQGRGDVRAVGALRRVEEASTSRARGAWSRLETAIRGTCAPRSAARSGRELRRLHASARGARQGRRPEPPGARRERGDRGTWCRIRAAGEKRLGVFWHTQGSGKSLSMLWFTQKVLRRSAGRVDVRDGHRPDANSTTSSTASSPMPGRSAEEADVHAETSAAPTRTAACRPPLRVHADPEVPARQAAGRLQMPVLSDRDDVIVITDEAHRSQYDTLALNMRRALPNARSWASPVRRWSSGRS